jgi:hypothetical protein
MYNVGPSSRPLTKGGFVECYCISCAVEELEAFNIVLPWPEFVSLPEVCFNVQSSSQCLYLGERLTPQAEIAAVRVFFEKDESGPLFADWAAVLALLL